MASAERAPLQVGLQVAEVEHPTQQRLQGLLSSSDWGRLRVRPEYIQPSDSRPSQRTPVRISPGASAR